MSSSYILFNDQASRVLMFSLSIVIMRMFTWVGSDGRPDLLRLVMPYLRRQLMQMGFGRTPAS